MHAFLLRRGIGRARGQRKTPWFLQMDGPAGRNFTLRSLAPVLPHEYRAKSSAAEGLVSHLEVEFTVDVDPRLRATEHDNESVPSASGEPLGLRRENGVVSAVRARKDADGPLGIHGPQAKAPGVGEALLRLVSRLPSPALRTH
ncbi:MAG: hypothetical protein KBI47_11845 [Armatimonadetes bacterium]|nr:hypothetical protein [Armatimonadota bacterium]